MICTVLPHVLFSTVKYNLISCSVLDSDNVNTVSCPVVVIYNLISYSVP